ncbi:hypothetical protein BX600DRAFT_431357 [Xylariales sp. PMI_506]|nr:hypothetical protein BX600DRAFT_431357 [Xylariales sp. PMI_506]
MEAFSSPPHSPTSSADEAYLGNDEASKTTMGREHQSIPVRGRGLPRRVELDLGAVLSIEQKNQLLTLVGAILDGMQKHIRDVFEVLGDSRDTNEPRITLPKPVSYTIPNPNSPKYAQLYGRKPPLAQPIEDERSAQREKSTSFSDITTMTFPSGMSVLKLPRSPEEATLISGKMEEREVVTASMIEMKRDVLAFFGKWRGNILKRVGEFSIKGGGNAGSAAGQGPAGSTGNARRPGSAPRGRSARLKDPVLAVPVQESNAACVKTYQPYSTQLMNLPREKRALIMHIMLLTLLGLENYSAYARIFLLHLANSLGVPMHVLAQDELRVARSLSIIVKGMTVEEIAQRRAEESRSTRKWKPAGGGPGTALSGGGGGQLAAPLVAAGIGTVFGGFGLSPIHTAGLLGAMAESTVVIGTLFGLYGARATAKMMESYTKDIQDFGIMPIRGSSGRGIVDPKDIPPEDRRLRVTIGIHGWLSEKNSITDLWKVLGSQNETYTLRWETESLTKFGQALEIVCNSLSWSAAKRETYSQNVFFSVENSLWPGNLHKISKIIDNPWSVGMVRAEKAGHILADAIVNKLSGERPVSLIGYSLGARVIYTALMQLSEKRALGHIENVVLMGAPCPTEVRVWAAMKSMVPGRLINVYSNSDYLLGFLSRNGNWQYGIAGLQKIQGVSGVENLDVSETISSHFHYRLLVGPILKKLGWEDLDPSIIARDEMALTEALEVERRREKSHQICLDDETRRTQENIRLNMVKREMRDTVAAEV